MTTVLLGPHDGDASNNLPARIILVKDKGGEPISRALSSLSNQNEVARHASPRDVPLVTVNHPAVAFFLGPRANHAGV